VQPAVQGAECSAVLSGNGEMKGITAAQGQLIVLGE
jgi:hypothetical protein